MTGYDIFAKAVLRLGYDQSHNEHLIGRGAEFVSQIAADLRLPAIKSLSEEIEVGPEGLEALCCGVAMLLALSEADGERHRLFCELYNAKRGSALGHNDRVEDRLPTAESGDI